MELQGDAAAVDIDGAVAATADARESDGEAIRDVEMASPPDLQGSAEGGDDVVDASSPAAGFHRSLGTRTTGKATGGKPAPFMRDESFKRISRSPVPFGSLSEAFAFTVFLLLYILATTVIGQDEHDFYFSNRVRAAMVERDFEVAIQQGASSAQKRFSGIQDQGDVWAFLQGPFLDAVYGTSLINEADTDTQASAGTMMLSYNRVLGGVRFRTLRVVQDSCPQLARIPEYAALVPYCYGRFEKGVEETKGYGPILNSADITASLCFKFAQSFFKDKQSTKAYSDLQTCYSDCARSCGDYYGVERFRYTKECTSQCGVHCKCIYEQPVGFTNLCADPNPRGANADLPAAIFSYNWSSAASTLASKATAYTNAYPGSGYVVDLPLSGTSASASIAQMKKNRYLDLATRALVIDFTVFNAYLQLFNIVQFVIEFPASGGVYASFSDVVIDIFQYSAPVDTARIVLELFLVAFIVWRWKTLLQKWYSMGFRTYFAYDSLWHSIETAHLTMFLVVIGFRLYVIDLSYGTLSGSISKAIQAASSPSDIPTFHSLAWVREIDAILSSLNAAFVWMQFLKYTQMSKRMCLLLRTLRRASFDLVWFCVYFLTCICAFAQIGYLLFGLQLAAFRSLGVAIVTLLQAVAGDLEYAALVEAHRALGPMFYVSFYLLLLLILLNVFLAIVNDAYVQTLSEQEEEDEAEEAALLRSEVGGTGESTLDPLADVEAQLKRLERRELEQLRKYPFSKGLSPAIRLLLADLKRTLYEMRTGRRLFKVDPMVSGMLGVMGDAGAGSSSGARGAAGVASRKLTIQVKRQLEKQMQLQEAARDAKRAQIDKAQREAMEGQQNELAGRLTTLVESNHEKSKRMADMEGMLGSIEKLCQQLVTAAMEDVPSSPKRPTTTAQSASARPLTGSTALAMALQRQKTVGKSSGSSEGKIGEAVEIEEITL